MNRPIPHCQSVSLRQRDAETEAAELFESQVYPHATPETIRLLAHSRRVIRLFLESELGRELTSGVQGIKIT